MYFYSYSLGKRTMQEEDPGVMGDRGWGIGNYLVKLDQCVSAWGRWDLLRDVWRDRTPLAPAEALADGIHLSIDKTLGYFDVLQDWAWMDAGSNDAGGNGPVVDCAQATYNGYAALGRMARALGDEETALKADYLRARSTVPLIARLPFERYARDNGLLGPDDFVAGFREDAKAKYSVHFGNDMTDISAREALRRQFGYWELIYAGVETWDVLFPYARYLWPQLLTDRARMDQLYLPTRPARIIAGEENVETMFGLFAGDPVGPKLEHLKAVYFYNVTQHPHIAIYPFVPALYVFNPVPQQLTLALSGGCPLVIGNWDPLPPPVSLFDPETRSVRLELKAVPTGYTLYCLSERSPQSVRINGESSARWSYDPQTHALLLQPPTGSVLIKVVYDQLDLQHFRPLPLRVSPTR